MKKFISILAVITLAFTIGCGGDDSNGDDSSNDAVVLSVFQAIDTASDASNSPNSVINKSLIRTTGEENGLSWTLNADGSLLLTFTGWTDAESGITFTSGTVTISFTGNIQTNQFTITQIGDFNFTMPDGSAHTLTWNCVFTSNSETITISYTLDGVTGEFTGAAQ